MKLKKLYIEYKRILNPVFYILIVISFFALFLFLYNILRQMINESTIILILSLSSLAICLFVYNKTRKELYMFLFIIPYSYFLLTNYKDIIVYSLGAIVGYVSDFIGVKRGLWKYPTKSGYSLWVGLGWAAVMLSVSKMQNISLILVLILSAIYILISFLFDNLKFWNKSSLLIYPVFLLVLFGGYPKILLISFFIGPYIEFTYLWCINLFYINCLRFIIV